MNKSLISILAVFFIIPICVSGCKFWESKNADGGKTESRTKTEEVSLDKSVIEEIGLITETVSVGEYSNEIIVPAKVISNQDNEAIVGTLVPGRVYKVFAKAGDYVRAGQDLMQIVGLEIGEIKAAFLKARANLEYHKLNYERQKALIQQKVGSQKSYSEAQAEYEKALAEYNAEDRKIHSIGLNDADIIEQEEINGDDHSSGTLMVKSPINGIVAARNIVLGQHLDGEVNAFRIINTNSLWIDGQIYEKDLESISCGAEVVFKIPSYPGELFKGKINFIDPVVDEKSRTITVRSEVFNSKGMLKPQMFGEMKIISKTRIRAIFIPESAIIRDPAGEYVFVRTADTLFQKRDVNTGIQLNERVQIKAGLNTGDILVVKGSFYLKSELKKEELTEEH